MQWKEMCGDGKKPPYWTRGIFIGQSLKVELYEKTMEAGVDGRSKKT
jgi:hypothetical protein